MSFLRDPLLQRPEWKARRQIDAGITWVNIFNDLITTLEYSTLVYSINSIRDAARKGKIENIDSVFKTPIKFSKLHHLLEEHHEVIVKNLPDDLPYLLTPLEDKLIRDAITVGFYASTKAADSMVESNLIVSPYSQLHDSEQLLDTQCIVYNDSNHMKELVYGIFLDGVNKRIVVSFRGTVTSQDIKQDVNDFTKKTPNPLGHFDGQPENISIHSGFYSYLFANYEPDARTTKRQKILVGTKYEEISLKVSQILKKHPGYDLYITGHSLGGALATLFTFYISLEPSDAIQKPVSCVSFASPKVGNRHFAIAFQHQELKGCLRHLRVHNEGDPIPPFPPVFLRSSFRPSKIYHHVGISLKLKQFFGLYSITIKPIPKVTLWNSFLDVINALLNHFVALVVVILPCIPTYFAKYHTLDVYFTSVRRCLAAKNLAMSLYVTGDEIIAGRSTIRVKTKAEE